MGVFWPHVLHGEIAVERSGNLLVYQCVCGERLGLPIEVAVEMKLA